MKKLSRKEMKNVKGGSAPVAECTTECIYNQAGCDSKKKACSTGPGTFDWKCC